MKCLLSARKVSSLSNTDVGVNLVTDMIQHLENNARQHYRNIRIFICSRNRFLDCHRLLRSLVRQIVIFDLAFFVSITILENGSTEKQKKLYKTLHKLIECVNSYNISVSGLSEARNIAISMTRKDEYLYFLDDDVIVESDLFLKNLSEIINTHHPDLLGGPVSSKLPVNLPHWFKKEWVTRHFGLDGFGAQRLSGGNFGISGTLCDGSILFDRNLGMRGGKIRLGEEKDFVEQYLARTDKPQIFYSSDLSVAEQFGSEKTKLSYRIRREFAIGYAAHLNHHTSHLKTNYRPFASLKMRDFKRAFRYIYKSAPSVYSELKYSERKYLFVSISLFASRMLGLFLRKLRWRT